MKKISKLFFSIITLSVWIMPFSVCNAMKLTKFDKPVADIFSDASLFLLSIIGGIALLVIIIGGILYIFAGANPEAQNKAKGTVTKAIIGLIFVLVSYAVVSKLSYISSGMGIIIGSASVTPISGPPGTEFTIKASIMAANGEVDSATTIAYIQSPDEAAGPSIALLDNGLGADSVAGDGIFSAVWPSGAFPEGPYFVDIEACNTEGECTEAENI